MFATCLSMAGALLLGLFLQLTVVGTLKHNRDQQIAYDDLRLSLAEGTTPVGPGDDGKPIPKGAPIARIDMPSINVKEIVLEGTTSTVLRSGPGHRRDTVLPGQAGTSIVMGRRMGYGGPFSHLSDLNTGDTFTVVTGQGTVQYRVLGIRRAGDMQPAPPPAGSGRLTLMTSSGSRFAPDDALRVDADVVGTAFPASTPGISTANLPGSEIAMAQEAGALKGTILWGIVLAAAAIGCTWLRLTWGRWQAWLIGVPVLAYVGISTADHAIRILPNLL
jgi:LPXTG-site transpeptidase (sortase) family protein